MTYPIRREIPYNDAAFTLRMNFPEHWALPTKVTLNVRDLDGNLLVTAVSSTLAAANTTSAATVKGERTIALVGATAYEAGDLIRIGSDAEGWQQAVVESYNSGSQTITTTDRWNYVFSSGAALEARFATYELDASGWADSVREVTAEWIPTGDAATIVDTWRVLKRVADVGGLEETFKVSYPSEYNELSANDFNIFQDRAHRIISTEWQGRSLDLDKLVDSDNEYRELLLRQIAYLINPSDIRSQQYTDYFARVSTLEKWIDSNQDLIQDDNELRTGTAFNFMRKF